MSENAVSDTEWSIVRDAVMDSDDWEYTLAGQLVGTDWNFPEHGTDTIDTVRESSERQRGQRMDYPEAVLKYSGHRIPVSGFLRRIDPNDIGEVEPAGKVAERIVSLQNERSWRQVHTDSDCSGGGA